MIELQGSHGDDPREPHGETLPRLLRRRAAEHGPRDFLRAKRHGVWAATSWSAALARVEALARAMIARGVDPGDVVAVIGENVPEAYLVQYAALCAGAAATHLYPDASAAELGFVLKNSGARLLFAEDQEQVDKFLESGAAGPTSPVSPASSTSTSAASGTTTTRCWSRTRASSPARPPTTRRASNSKRASLRPATRTWPRSATPRAPPAGRRACA